MLRDSEEVSILEYNASMSASWIVATRPRATTMDAGNRAGLGQTGSLSRLVREALRSRFSGSRQLPFWTVWIW